MKVRVPTLIFQKEIPKAVKMKYKDGCKWSKRVAHKY
jgi:hypothetical protein